MVQGQLELGKKPTEKEFETILPQLPKNLPVSFFDFVKQHSGGNGDLPVQPYYFHLWTINELIENNRDYAIQENLPNYFGFGGNGGGEFLAINLVNFKVFTIPFVVMSERDAVQVAESFEEFLSLIGPKGNN